MKINLKLLMSLLMLLGSTTLLAHPLDLGVLYLKNSGKTLEAVIEMNPAAASQLTGNSREDLFKATLGHTNIQIKGKPCVFDSGVHPSASTTQSVSLKVSALCAENPGALQVTIGFLDKLPATFQLLVRAELNGRENIQTADVKNQVVTFEEVPQDASFARFIVMGMEHIGATPNQWMGNQGLHLPDGIDHILFVLALVLAGGGLMGILKTVTGFTVGHSVTLALATLGIVRLPSRLVESSIALSIAVVAAEALFFKSEKSRWRIAALFGLVHGLGFASALAELHLDQSSLLKALVGFNIGVEAGQAVIVAMMLPLLLFLRRYQVGRRYVVPTFAYAILIAGTYWFIRRAFGF